MGEVTISVGGRAYQIICQDGEEDRLTAVAARVDREASSFAASGASLPEARLLLMSALMLADQLEEAEARASAAAPPPPETATPAEAAAEDPALAAAMDEAAARLEALAEPIAQDAPPTMDEAPAEEALLPQETSADAAEPTADAEEDEPAESMLAEEHQEDAPAEDVAEHLAEEADDPALETVTRRPKSSRAVAAEKDLLSWLDKPEPRSEPDEPSEAEHPLETTPEEMSIEDDGEADVSLASEPELEGPDVSAVAETVQEESDEAPDDVAASDVEEALDQDDDLDGDEDDAIRARRERRRRRRERLAQLANSDKDS